MLQKTASSTVAVALSKKKSGTAKLYISAAIVTIILGAGGWFLWDAQLKPKPDLRKNLITVRKGPAEMNVVATGAMRPYREVKISPKQTGLLSALYVKQGDLVKTGQIIAQMDDSNLVGQVEAARGAYLASLDNAKKLETGNRPQEVAAARFQELRSEKAVLQAERNISRLEAQVQALTATVKRDQAFAARQTMLAKAGAVSDQASIDAQTAAEVSKAQLDAAKREKDQSEIAAEQSREELNAVRQQHSLMKSGFRKEEVAASGHNAMQAKGQLMHMESLLADTKVRAPFDGIVTQKYADVGAIVTPTTSAATTSATSSSIVALASKLEMVAQVSESNIAKIKPGQEVEITATSYPSKTFKGTVTQVAPAAIVTQNVTTFEVHVDVSDPARELLSGMNVNAKFAVGSMKNALIVPQVCVLSRRGQTGVYVPDKNGEPEFRPVKTGPTSGRDIVIVSGLSENEKLFEGLTREQLTREGYGNRDQQRGGPGGGSPFGAMGGGGGGGRGGRGGGFGR